MPNTLRRGAGTSTCSAESPECRATRMINVYRPAEAVALAERGMERARRANEPEAYALLLRHAGGARVYTGE